MNTEPIEIPDFRDISPEVQAAASAAMDSGKPLKPSPDAKRATDKKVPPGEYFRWTEAAVIENAWRDGKDGIITAVVQYKIRAGFHNEHERGWARHSLNFALLMGQENDPEKKKKHEFMNNSSINAINSLLTATGLAPKTGADGKHVPLKASLLNHLFPVKGQPGVSSPLVGKTVMMNICDAPNTGAQAKYPRRTNIESYLPDTV